MHLYTYFQLAITAAFWIVGTAVCRHLSRQEWGSARPSHPVLENMTCVLLVALGLAAGWLNIYSHAPSDILQVTNALWAANWRILAISVTALHVSATMVACFAALGLGGFFLLETIKDGIAAYTGKPRIVTAG